MFSWWKAKEIQTRKKITVGTKSENVLRAILRIFFFVDFVSVSSFLKIELQNDLKILQEQGSASPALV